MQNDVWSAYNGEETSVVNRERLNSLTVTGGLVKRPGAAKRAKGARMYGTCVSPMHVPYATLYLKMIFFL